jgi:hypothetical protein
LAVLRLPDSRGGCKGKETGGWESLQLGVG